MSRIITYGFFGEDTAQRNFLTKYLTHQYPNTFIEDENERWRFKARNRDQVDAFLPEALLQKVILRLDVLFVGRDIDTSHEPTIKTRREEFEKKCIGHHPVVLMLPVQCVEHWLWYIKRRREEPGRNTPLEPQPRTSAKQAIYADTKLVAKQVVIANDILVDLDVSWLEQRSESFKHFHKQLIDFLDQYDKTL
ncbi:hypothetical protein [Spirosoma arcticum]